MSNIPSFKTGTKPQLSKEEYNAEVNKVGGKFLQEPGTYDLTIKAVSFKDKPNDKDSAWIDTTIELEGPDGQTMRHFQMIPTECRNSFLFGEKKAVFALESLQKFFRALGLQFDYENGMEQVAAVFGNPDSLIGKSVKARVGYKGPHLKYLGKSEANIAQYQVVDSDHTTLKIEGVFADKDSALAAAADAGIAKNKISGFMNVLEFFSAKEPALIIGNTQTVNTVDLPF